MISPDTAGLILDLLATGASMRSVATAAGVSRGTVARVRQGYRGYTPVVNESGPPERCRSCGCLVYPPCVRCQTIAHLEAKGGAA